MNVPEEIRTRHEPMDSGDRGYLLCGRCDEIWPCDAAQLLAVLELREGPALEIEGGSRG